MSIDKINDLTKDLILCYNIYNGKGISYYVVLPSMKKLKDCLYMAGKTEYKNKFASEKYDRVGLMLKKGSKQPIQDVAST